MNKKLTTVLCTITLCLFVFCQSALAFIEPTSEFYVADYADVLSQSTKNDIIDTGAELEERTSAQVVLVTVDFLDGMTSDVYAAKVLNDWGVGSKEENNGVVILLCPGEGKFWIVQGAGLEKKLSSGMLDTIIDENLTYDFDSGNFDDAAINTYEAVVQKLEVIYGINDAAGEPSGSNNPGSSGYTSTRSKGGSMFFIVLLIVVLIIVFTSKNRGRSSGYRAPRFRNYQPPRDHDIFEDRHSSPKGGFFRGGNPGSFSRSHDDDDDDHFFGGGGGGFTGGGGAGRSGGSSGSHGGFSSGGRSSGGSRSGGGGGTRGGGAGRK